MSKQNEIAIPVCLQTRRQGGFANVVDSCHCYDENFVVGERSASPFWERDSPATPRGEWPGDCLLPFCSKRRQLTSQKARCCSFVISGFARLKREGLRSEILIAISGLALRKSCTVTCLNSIQKPQIRYRVKTRNVLRYLEIPIFHLLWEIRLNVQEWDDNYWNF